MRKRITFGFSLLFIGALIGSVYFATQSNSIYGGDAGDLVSAIITRGIPHPPGYPLYTQLGILVTTYIPYGTLAWRASLLSSIPSLITSILLFTFLTFVSRRILPSFVASTVYAFLYPVWLFSIVPEVFSLNSLFLISIFVSFWLWFIHHKKKYVYTGSFLFGLSLTHHHIILFLTPVLFYFLLKSKIFVTRKICIMCCIYFFLGLMPYGYVYFSALGNPAVNWQGMPTPKNIFELITRAGYGTFKIGISVVNQPQLRLLSYVGLFDLMLKDFRILGIILIFAGLKNVYANRKLFIALIWILGSYLFFLFYASYPLADNFTIGTFERFLTPLYLFFALCLCFGIIEIDRIIQKYILFSLSSYKKSIVSVCIYLLFFLYPISIFIINYPKISSLKKDFTAEHLGEDLLSSVPENSIVILMTDTVLFNAQYMYYSAKMRPDVKLIHLSKIYSSYYLGELSTQYPDLRLPDKNLDSRKLFETFLSQNYGNFPIFTKLVIPIDDGVWVPWGLLFRYYKKSDVPKDEYIRLENEKLWKSYHDPLDGSLSMYQNLLLSDVLRVYGVAHQEFGFWAARHELQEVAQKHLLASKKLYPSDFDTDVILAQSYLIQKKCAETAEVISHLSKKDPDYDLNTYFLELINQLICKGDKEKSAYFEKLYRQMSRGKEIQLKKL